MNDAHSHFLSIGLSSKINEFVNQATHVLANFRTWKSYMRKYFLHNFAMGENGTHNPLMKIGAAIRQIRLEKGLTLEAVALEAGTYAGNLSKIERSRQMPSLELLDKLSQALAVPLSKLCAVAESEGQALEQALTDSNNEMILLRRNFQALNSQNRKLAIEFLKLLGQSQSAG